MTVVFYCQHVLGLGHYMRSLAIVEALSPHRVVFVTGGPEVPAELPPHVVHERLPAIGMDEGFNRLLAEGDLATVQARRRDALLAVLERERPEALVVELYPFGRRAFEFELVPALTAARRGDFGRPAILCSLRDILVEKSDPAKYQRRVLARLGEFFDGLLVHSDRRLFPLEETFERAAEIPVPVAYTGFVVRRPAPDARQRVRQALGLADGDKLVVASAGGGKVGGELLFATVAAHPMLACHPRPRLEVFTGPFLDEQAFLRLGADAVAHESVRVSRFAGNFPDLLAGADLSLSLAGYNTTMNVLAAGVPALVWPFAQNREQAMRAGRLRDMGALGLLRDEDLEPARLAGLASRRLLQGRGDGPCPVDLDGARRSAELIVGWPEANI